MKEIVMKDLEISLTNSPGTLAMLGEVLGRHHISLEGGGVFTCGTVAVAHFLVAEPEKAKQVLEQAQIKVTAVNEVIIQKLRQDVPGQLGMFCRKLAAAGVNILTQYSDHDHRLIIIADDMDTARRVSAAWGKEWRDGTAR